MRSAFDSLMLETYVHPSMMRPTDVLSPNRQTQSLLCHSPCVHAHMLQIEASHFYKQLSQQHLPLSRIGDNL